MVEPLSLIKPKRRIEGISAVLLPVDSQGKIHWPDFAALLQRTCAAGLTPAVNMDTGFVNFIDGHQRREVLQRARQILGEKPMVAGAFVDDRPGDAFDVDRYRRAIDEIKGVEATPVIFQSFGLVSQEDEAIVASYQAIAEHCHQLIAFELGPMFAPFGKIYGTEVFRELMQIENCRGAKHSSLSRELEWQRLAIRDQIRPEFQVFTGNDLAIDMVMYGSDYLLGLSTLAPDFFARRDQYWLEGDSRFYILNDVLQFLGHFAFRVPVPAYKHTAAMFLHLRGWIESGQTHPQGACRSAADLPVLAGILDQLNQLDDLP